MKKTSLCILAMMMLYTTAIAQEQNTNLVGRWADGPCYDVSVSGDIACYGNGGKLVVMNISDPEEAAELGSIVLPSVILGITIEGNFVYVADWRAGLRIIDISTPSNPSEVGFLNTNGYAYKVVVQGGFAFLADGYEGLRIIDVSNPTTPQEVGFYDTEGTAKDISISNQYAYIADKMGGTRIIDVSNPINPFEVYNIELIDSDGAESVSLSGDYAYISEGSNIRVFDVSNPVDPIQIAAFTDDFFSYNIIADQNRLYVLSGWDLDELVILDISTPSTPSQLSRIFLGRYYFWDPLQGIHIENQHAYIACGVDGLQIVNIADPVFPSKIDSVKTGGFTLDVIISDEIAYVATEFGGLRILEISDPTIPTEIGCFHPEFSYPEWTYFPNVFRLDVEDNFAYVLMQNFGLTILDVSSSSNPIETSTILFRGGWYGAGILDLSIRDDYAFIVGDHLRVVDISDPFAPIDTAECWTEGAGVDIILNGDYLYSAELYAGLGVYDISDPLNPQPITNFIIEDTEIYGVAISDHYAYLAAYEAGLVIIDISDPDSLVRVGSLDTDGYAINVAHRGQSVYLADGHNGMRVIDVTDPSNPYETGYYQTGGFAMCVATNDNNVFVADGDAGLYILGAEALPVEEETSLPARFALKQNHPNPFNPTTTIEYELPELTEVKLTIFNISGQEVVELVRGIQPAGTFNIEWNGTDSQGELVSSGMYLARIETANYSSSIKMLYLK